MYSQRIVCFFKLAEAESEVSAQLEAADDSSLFSSNVLAWPSSKSYMLLDVNIHETRVSKDKPGIS